MDGLSICRLAAGNLRSTVFDLLLKLLWRGRRALLLFKDPSRALHQLLLRHHPGLQSSDGGIDSDILFLGATVEEEENQGSHDQHGNGSQDGGPQRPASLVD